jgi:hypothetical protein
MASTRGIAGACEAIVRLLRSRFDPQNFGGATLDFQVYVAEDFLRPMEEGVSLFLYRIYHNGTQRIVSGRVLPDGSRQRSKLPVDLHFLLTAWAKKASLQHEIAGWMMRVLEDTPMLTPNLLNAYRAGEFLPEEAVEVAPAQLSVEDMFHVWEVMINHVYQLSVPYQARLLQLESDLVIPAGPPVQERVADYRQPA